MIYRQTGWSIPPKVKRHEASGESRRGTRPPGQGDLPIPPITVAGLFKQ